jgi:hypothetical protein
VVTALLLDYRSRIAVALVVALALGLASRYGFSRRWPKSLPDSPTSGRFPTRSFWFTFRSAC